jgi:beta-lactamase class A
MESVTVPAGARLSVAVLDLASGASASYGTGGEDGTGGGSFDTASIVKVDILAALLLRAQDAGRELSAWEKADAAAMIEDSDNAAASELYTAIGGAAGLTTANRRLGLERTEAAEGMLWGLTQTTAADQLRLLQQVFGMDEDAVLTRASRAYVQELMTSIAPGQHWGVSAAADPAAAGSSPWALKNGWLPRTATGLWDVNSIGRVTSDGRDYLVAVLSAGHTTQAGGIAVVEATAKAAVGVLAGYTAGYTG